MALPAPRPACYEDLFDLPEHLVGEIVGGRLHAHPRPAPKHARAAATLGRRVGNPFDDGLGGPGGWWILIEPEIHLGRDIVVPDLAGWRRARLPRLPATAWFELVPDWLCEILSPATARHDRHVKLPLYAQAGVSHLWLIDPEARSLESFDSRDGRWSSLALLHNEAQVAQPPFDAVAFPLDALWAD